MHKPVAFTLIPAAIMAVLFAFLVMPVQKGLAASASLSLSASSQSVAQGENLVLTVKLDTGGDPVNGVQANINYSPARFDTVTISSTSAFTVAAQSETSDGVIRIARGAMTPVTGNADVAVITLHSSSAGAANFSFAAESAVVKSTDSTDILTSNPSASYTITPPPQCSASLGNADVNNDGIVNVFDLVQLLNDFGKSTAQLTRSRADVNSDGIVNVFDLVQQLNKFGLKQC